MSMDEPGQYTRNMLSAASRLGLDDVTRESAAFESLGRIIDELARRVVELEAAKAKPGGE